ncbi:hypothetical protein MK805_06330 [Shimazuella sp. AN120528]|uniref:hypothetical protein n=1 Tax=Shimazuella soli TaxID=1892854 RepID=UPI001F0F23FE|nr:hypothetical protein [Shimazuella soli]MCH5584585.1 hypothetical protein [Shimazuella soli]
MKKPKLSVGKEIYGAKDIKQAFYEAFAPYFEQNNMHPARFVSWITQEPKKRVGSS